MVSQNQNHDVSLAREKNPFPSLLGCSNKDPQTKCL